jgi:dTDP-4-amino-4,6-dideoxygalactose transaminase
LTCFSFYATKTITTGEGGMVCTGDDVLGERCRIMALHGISKDAWKRYTAAGSWYYEIIAPGFKYNLTDVAAAIGLVQLRRAESMWRRRREIAMRYNEAFSALPELEIPSDRADCQHAWHLYLLRLNLDRLRIDRADFVEELKAYHIGTSVHFIPLHVHPYYRETYGYTQGDFPVAFNEFQRVISLPIYSTMRGEDVDDVISIITYMVQKWRT